MTFGSSSWNSSRLGARCAKTCQFATTHQWVLSLDPSTVLFSRRVYPSNAICAWGRRRRRYSSFYSSFRWRKLAGGARLPAPVWQPRHPGPRGKRQVAPPRSPRHSPPRGHRGRAARTRPRSAAAEAAIGGENWKEPNLLTKNSSGSGSSSRATRRSSTGQGAVVQTWREYAGRHLGPYFRLIFRQDGRQRSLYLGSDPQFAGVVRDLLEQVQRPLRERRSLQRLRAGLERELQRCKIAWDAELRPYGLRLKGWEVRGWRTARVDRRCVQLAEVSEAGARGPVASG